MAEKVMNEKPSTEGRKKYGWGIRHLQMVCMSLCMISLFMVRSAMGVAVLAMTDLKNRREGIETYEWDKERQGVILSSFFWGYLVMQVPGGVLSKRFGGKPILMVALVANGAIFAMLPTLARVCGWQVVCAARVVMGMAQACLFSASHTLLGRWLPAHERTALMGAVYGGPMVGMIIALPVSGLLAASALGWKMIFYALAAMMAVIAAIWQTFAASSPAQHRLISPAELEYIEEDLNAGNKGGGSRSRLRTPWRAILTSRRVWAVAAAHFGMCGAFTLFFVDMPTYMEKGLHLSLKNSALLSALPYAGMWLGTSVSSYLCGMFNNRGILSLVVCRKLFNSLSFYVMTIGLVVLSFLGPEHSHLAVATLIVTLTFNGFCNAGFMINHLDLSPNFAGVLLSMTNFIANLNSVATPLITGTILKSDPSDLSRWRIVFLTVAAIIFLCNTIYITFGTADKQPWDNPDYCTSANDPEEMKPALEGEKEREANKDTAGITEVSLTGEKDGDKL